jgi:serine/threonine protein phosphatase PrpC
MVQGRREYMEDYTFASVEMGPDGEHKRSFFGVFDGHSGKKAAIHAKV